MSSIIIKTLSNIIKVVILLCFLLPYHIADARPTPSIETPAVLKHFFRAPPVKPLPNPCSYIPVGAPGHCPPRLHATSVSQAAPASPMASLDLEPDAHKPPSAAMPRPSMDTSIKQLNQASLSKSPVTPPRSNPCTNIPGGALPPPAAHCDSHHG